MSTKFELPNTLITDWLRYNELFTYGASRNPAEETEFSGLNTLLTNYLISAVDWNEIQNIWDDWTPTVIWGTATPTVSVVQVARYSTDANICYFNYSYTANDGNSASSLSISLPVTPKDNSSKIALNSQEKVDTTWTNPMAYIDDGASIISFRTFSVATDTKAVEIIITGFYEI